MDVILQCPWCGDGIGVDNTRVGDQITCTGCNKSVEVSKAERIPSYDDGEYESIAFVAGERSRRELDSILTRNGIVYGLRGSRGHQVVVNKRQARLARELLRKGRSGIGGLTLYAPGASSPKKLRWLTRLVQWTRR